MSSLLPALGDIGLGAINTIYGIFSNERARGDSRGDVAWQKDLSERQFSYQKDLNQLQMDREDTQFQRRSADMQAAGLHPTLAVGGAGATTPAMGNIGGGSNSLQAPPVPKDLQKQYSIMDMAYKAEEMRNIRAQTGLTEAERERVQADVNRVRAETADIERNTLDRPRYLNIEETRLGMEVEKQPYSIQQMKNQLEMYPEQFSALLLDNKHRENMLTQDELNASKTRQETLLLKMQTDHETLKQLATATGITETELKNRILLADATYNERYALHSSRANDWEAINMFMVDVLGIDPNSRQAGDIRSILMMTQYVVDIGLRILGRNRPQSRYGRN